ncbi:hypothetical protein [Parendozoicomonas haliclonae]|uniref:Uncharacterized protein n=1 Tax=Parendozoicomonas haliclonae TaxID=1960125 RepID=A0A1X7ANL2_9GAMM|nr:hypothetical protein [Parendozoicomonas haliclonae]SMA49733.1 hypothetical protein EHSB41UT_03515 [Parendozoicomonas haliclonae]
MVDRGNEATGQRMLSWGYIPFEEGLHGSNAKHWRPANEKATESLRLSSPEAMAFAQDLAYGEVKVERRKLNCCKVVHVFCRTLCTGVKDFFVEAVADRILLLPGLTAMAQYVYQHWDELEPSGKYLFITWCGLCGGAVILERVWFIAPRLINRIKEAVNTVRERQAHQTRFEACMHAEEKQQLIDGVDDNIPGNLVCPVKMHLLSDPVYITHHSELYSSGFVWNGIAGTINHPTVPSRPLTKGCVIPDRKLSRKQKKHLVKVRRACEEWRSRLSYPDSCKHYQATG